MINADTSSFTTYKNTTATLLVGHSSIFNNGLQDMVLQDVSWCCCRPLFHEMKDLLHVRNLVSANGIGNEKVTLVLICFYAYGAGNNAIASLDNTFFLLISCK